MAVAKIYPEPEKGGCGKKGAANGEFGIPFARDRVATRATSRLPALLGWEQHRWEYRS